MYISNCEFFRLVNFEIFRCRHSYWSPIWLKFGVLSKSLHSILIKWVLHPPRSLHCLRMKIKFDKGAKANVDGALLEWSPSENVKVWKLCQLFALHQPALVAAANTSKKREKLLRCKRDCKWQWGSRGGAKNRWDFSKDFPFLQLGIFAEKKPLWTLREKNNRQIGRTRRRNSRASRRQVFLCWLLWRHKCQFPLETLRWGSTAGCRIEKTNWQECTFTVSTRNLVISLCQYATGGHPVTDASNFPSTSCSSSSSAEAQKPL